MAEKLTVNANFVCKSDKITPKKCVVEKVIEVCDTEFKNFTEKPMQRNYCLSPFKELMGFYNDAYHGVLFVNKESGDGLLVNSEGADYARYSQFIPNASEIISKHKQAHALSELEQSLKNWVVYCVSDSGEKKDFCVDIDEFLKDKDTQELLSEWVCEELKAHPTIGFVEKHRDTVVAVKGDIVETKLYCPLKLMSEPVDYDDDIVEEYPGKYVDYVPKINAEINRDIMCDEDMHVRGLTAYTDNNHLYCKVHSAFPKVEVRDGNLYGVIAVKSYGKLDKAELLDLIDEISGQLSDGWGEGFEQREIKLGDDKVYISFWNSDNYFLKPESEVFPENKVDMTMGGLS
jgi:hypothetical protein